MGGDPLGCLLLLPGSAGTFRGHVGRPWPEKGAVPGAQTLLVMRSGSCLRMAPGTSTGRLEGEDCLDSRTAEQGEDECQDSNPDSAPS